MSEINETIWKGRDVNPDVTRTVIVKTKIGDMWSFDLDGPLYIEPWKTMEKYANRELLWCYLADFIKLERENKGNINLILDLLED